MARILTAVYTGTEGRVRRILTGHYLQVVDKLAAAIAALDETIDLIFVGVRFDDSRMFDLLDHIRHDAKLKKIPVIAAIISPTAMSAETIAGLEHTTKIGYASS
jgi:CheY-like chemotaxis protein